MRGLRLGLTLTSGERVSHVVYSVPAVRVVLSDSYLETRQKPSMPALGSDHLGSRDSRPREFLRLHPQALGHVWAMPGPREHEKRPEGARDVEKRRKVCSRPFQVVP